MSVQNEEKMSYCLLVFVRFSEVHVVRTRHPVKAMLIQKAYACFSGVVDRLWRDRDGARG